MTYADALHIWEAARDDVEESAAAYLKAKDSAPAHVLFSAAVVLADDCCALLAAAQQLEDAMLKEMREEDRVYYPNELDSSE